MEQTGDVVRAVREYVRYLLESGVEHVGVPGKQAGPNSGWRTGATAPPVVRSDLVVGQGLKEIQAAMAGCMGCALAKGRKNIVFGEGNPEAEIVFVGEGPGGEEDLTGRPFVGPAGQLLTRIIEKGMQIPRSSVYICNIVKCRPPGNRTPEEDEVQACLPYLEKQLEAIGPKVIVALGLPATRTLLGTGQRPMHELRGRWHEYRGIPVMPVFHPSYVLRRYTLPVRRQVYEDTLEVLRFLGRELKQD